MFNKSRVAMKFITRASVFLRVKGDIPLNYTETMGINHDPPQTKTRTHGHFKTRYMVL